VTRKKINKVIIVMLVFVNVLNSIFATTLDGSAGIIGDVTSTNIESCSVTNLNLTTAKISNICL